MQSHPNASSEPQNPDADSWVQAEMATADLGDQRRTKRLIQILIALVKQPTASIPKACATWDCVKGAYRFFSNACISMLMILKPHFDATALRAREHKVVLVAQDTTSLNYSMHPLTRGLGPISNNSDKTIGFFVHSNMALTPQGVALGLVKVHQWKRDSKNYKVKCKKRNSLPLEQKESFRWLEGYRSAQGLAERCPGTLVVSMSDREGDLYEVMEELNACTGDRRAEVLVRSNHNRTVLTQSGERLAKLWDILSSQKISGYNEIEIRGRNGILKRTARLAIRFTPVKIKSPILKSNKGQAPSVSLWAIEAREVDPPAGVEPLHWRLLSSLRVEDLESALEKIGWYAQRWQIEEFHRVLKSGCKIEHRQLETRERLERVLAVDMIVAWRILFMTKLARLTPEAPAESCLDPRECQALQAYMEGKDGERIERLTLQVAVRRIARLGGFIGRKGDGQPGAMTLWRGLLRLHDITECWEVFVRSETKGKFCG